MPDPEPSQIMLLVFLILLSGLFSGSETALVSLTPAKIKAMQPKKYRTVRLIQRLKNKPQKMLTTILLGNNVVNIAATSYATVMATTVFSHNAVPIVTAIMTVFVLIFGEILPKAFANRFADKFAKFIIYPLLAVETVFFPIIWLLEKLVNGVLRLLGDTSIRSVTEDELKAMVSIGAEEGELEKHERELIENVLDFDDTEVSAIMTPRIHLDGLSDQLTVKEAIQAAIDYNHTRLPVYHEQVDEIIGIISIKDLLKLSQDEKQHEKTLAELEYSDVLRCPETRKIHSLFKEMQKLHVHIALIYDEHGGLEGLVTMEDILEELVGEIQDEHDDEEDDLHIQKLDPHTIIVSGSVVIKDIEEELNIEIEDYDANDHISWVVLDNLKRYPSEGEELEINPQLICKVVKIDKESKVIEAVQIRKF